MTRFTHRNTGFTLVELAMVLFIVSLLIGGLLMPLTAQNEIRGRQETDRALSNIRDALIGFAVVNGRLPCPAIAATSTGTVDADGRAAGVEATTANGGPCACTTSSSGIAGTGSNVCHETTPGYVTGVLPWTTLGIPETDAWGNRFTYTMISLFGRAATGQTTFGMDDTNTTACIAATPAASAFALCSSRTSASTGAIQVWTSMTSGTKIVSSTPAMVVSHGKNTLGAYMPSGAKISILAAGTDETENANGDATFVGNSAIDDQLVWLPTSILMGRMLSAGRLP